MTRYYNIIPLTRRNLRDLRDWLNIDIKKLALDLNCRQTDIIKAELTDNLMYPKLSMLNYYNDIFRRRNLNIRISTSPVTRRYIDELPGMR